MGLKGYQDATHSAWRRSPVLRGEGSGFLFDDFVLLLCIEETCMNSRRHAPFVMASVQVLILRDSSLSFQRPPCHVFVY